MFNLVVGVEIFLPLLIFIIIIMIQTILLVIAVLLLVTFTHNLILKDKIFLIQVQKGNAETNFAINVILISIALSYIIWYCN